MAKKKKVTKKPASKTARRLPTVPTPKDPSTGEDAPPIFPPPYDPIEVGGGSPLEIRFDPRVFVVTPSEGNAGMSQ